MSAVEREESCSKTVFHHKPTPGLPHYLHDTTHQTNFTCQLKVCVEIAIDGIY